MTNGNMDRIKIKICCIKSIAEANLAMKSGANAIGLVGQMPSGPGVIDISTIREISESFSDKVETFLLTSQVSSENIIKDYRLSLTTTIQLVDAVKEDDLKDVKEALPEVSLIQVIHVVDPSSIRVAVAIAPFVDGILLDSGNPNLKVKELGGTGRTHNWEVSRQIVSNVDIPVFLAGGLNSLNVADAIERVSPYGVDLCSGVRINDQLDESKLKEFVNSIRIS